MKNLIIILLLVPFTLFGQQWKTDFLQADKQQHFAAGYFVGFAVNCLSYDILKDTNLKVWQSKTISLGIGIGASALLGHLKEKYDKNNKGQYNRKDLAFTVLGGCGGAFTVRLALWNSIPISKVPKNVIIL